MLIFMENCAAYCFQCNDLKKSQHFQLKKQKQNKKVVELLINLISLIMGKFTVHNRL